MKISSQLKATVVYEKLEVNTESNKGLSEELTIAASCNTHLAGFIKLSLPESNLLIQGDEGELEVVQLFLGDICEHSDVLDFLLEEAIEFAGSKNRVITIEDEILSKEYLSEKGFERHNLREVAFWARGGDYHYNIKNIDVCHFSELKQAKLTEQDAMIAETISMIKEVFTGKKVQEKLHRNRRF